VKPRGHNRAAANTGCFLAKPCSDTLRFHPQRSGWCFTRTAVTISGCPGLSNITLPARPRTGSIIMPSPSNPAAMNTKIDWDNIRVSVPCNARWEDMAGDERARFCGQCRKNVFNLSAMTRTQIASLVQATEGRFCGRFYQRPDGRMITADCPTGQRRRRDRLARWGAAVFASVLLLFGVRTTGRAQTRNPSGGPKGQPSRLQGEVSMAPARMGDLAVPRTAVTNGPGPKREPMIMGKMAITPRTNRTAQPTSAK